LSLQDVGGLGALAGALEIGDGNSGQEGNNRNDNHDLHEREAAAVRTNLSRYLKLCQLVIVV